MNKKSALNIGFYSKVLDLLKSARAKVVRTINQTMVLTYFEIGKMIVEEEQGGKDRAEYGKQILKGLSNVLTNEFGKGFSVKNLERMRSFYQIYGISTTLLSKSSKKELSVTVSPKLKENNDLNFILTQIQIPN